MKSTAPRCIAWTAIVTALHGAVTMAVQAIHLGAVDFIEEPLQSPRLIESVRQALDLNATNRQAKSVVDEFMARRAKLSRREKEVMDRLVLGQSPRLTGTALGISHRTVSVYRSWILAKMGVDKLPQLICAAMNAKNAGAYHIEPIVPVPMNRPAARPPYSANSTTPLGSWR